MHIAKMDRLYLSRKLFDEMTLTSRLIMEITGMDLECEGIIAEREGLPYYSILPRQEIAGGKALLEDVVEPFAFATGERIKTVGIWHSHASFPVFHSSYDDFHLVHTILPLVGRQNRMLKHETKNIMSIVVNNNSSRSHSSASGVYCLYADKSGVCEPDVGLDGTEEYIDAVELIEGIGNNVSYKGIPLKETEHYGQVRGYYREVKKAIWHEVFRRGIDRLDRKLRRRYDETGKTEESGKASPPGLQKEDGEDCEGDKSIESNTEQVDEEAESGDEVHLPA